MLKYDSKLCTGCRICEQICIQVHYQGSIEDVSRIKVISNWPDEESVAVCRQCPNPKCIPACPTDAIQQIEGVIHIEFDKCTQCYNCLDACPFDAKVIDRKGFPVFCDTCNGSFQCSQLCPAKALK